MNDDGTITITASQWNRLRKAMAAWPEARMESRYDGFCDYHPEVRATHIFTCTDGEQFRDRFLCQPCADAAVTGADRPARRWLADGGGGFFPYTRFKMEQL